uniref:Uncharacterized protein n=1 Tax=Setaria italica TaxID=4555 RepID=K3Z251_SETIT
MPVFRAFTRWYKTTAAAAINCPARLLFRLAKWAAWVRLLVCFRPAACM